MTIIVDVKNKIKGVHNMSEVKKDFWSEKSKLKLTNGEMQKLASYLRSSTCYRQREIEICKELLEETKLDKTFDHADKQSVLDYLIEQNNFIESLLTQIESCW